MIPPGGYQAHRAVVPVQHAIGGLGWKTYRRVLRQIYDTFGDHEEMTMKGRNAARKLFFHRRGVVGDDQFKAIRDANNSIDDMRLRVVAAVENPKTGNVTMQVSREQIEFHGRKIETYAPQDIEKEYAKMKDNERRVVEGLRRISYKAKVKCM
eukprot:TRINITY_DN3493_c3_g1_i1.p1 TRINITY_DN3493_c3_g1~~TRINITY_DN3493_c3_g1_i1.p1  ORF type:complete len:153 (+),score=31.34 TRINITY_DN3493_c3_g1_i1:49-507(+)